MKIGFCTMEKFDNRLKDTVGSSRIRGNWLIQYWPEAEEYVIGNTYDVMIFQKVYWESFLHSTDYQGIKILDICDPDWLEGKPVMEYVDFMDATVTATPALAEFIAKMRPNARVVCIPDRVDLAVHRRKDVYLGPLKKLVWFGYSQNVHYIEQTFPDLINKGIELTIICDHPYNPPSSYKNIKLTNIPYSYPDIHREIVKHDAVLLPATRSDERGKFKSNNKTLTAWALGMPVVVVPEDLDRFSSAEERQKEGNERRKEVEEKWDVKQSVEEYKTLISRIISERG